jgi:hypothetical protein
MTTTHIFSANSIQVQDDLAIPISVFRSIYDSGQIKNFAFAEELASGKLPRNPLVITPVDVGKDFPENANFRLCRLYRVV